MLSSSFSMLNGHLCENCHRRNLHADIQEGFWIVEGCSVMAGVTSLLLLEPKTMIKSSICPIKSLLLFEVFFFPSLSLNPLADKILRITW